MIKTIFIVLNNEKQKENDLLILRVLYLLTLEVFHR